MAIYLLEDDESIRKFVIYALNQTGFDAVGFEKPSEFFEALKQNTPDIVLLDVMLPEQDGISVLKTLKSNSKTEKIPVIMLTAKSTEYDKVLGLDSGADDYIAKPFGTMELISRIKALLRRTAPVSLKEYRISELCVVPSKHSVTVSGEEIVLTVKEFEMLKMLLENRGSVLTRDTLLQKIWGYDYDGESRTVDVHIKTLRTKLKESGNLIETVRGVGYKIKEK